MVKRRVMALVILLAASALAFGAGQSEGKGMTRSNTLYMFPTQWGPPSSFNPLSPDPAFPVRDGGICELTYETLFGFNMLDGGMEPIIATSMKWVDKYSLEVVINAAAKFNDGQRLTAEDVAYTYGLARKYPISYSNYWEYLQDVKAAGANKVVFTMKSDNPNKLMVLDCLQTVPILPKHVWTKVEQDNGNDIQKIWKYTNENPVASGPYKVAAFSDTKIVLARDDAYWGVAVFGKLPVPQYIVHPIFKSNDQVTMALKEGQLDYSQSFIPQVWKLAEGGAPISCYMAEKPYYLPGHMPLLEFNMTKKGLDNPDVRKAIALCIDYERIAEVAMSGYSSNLKPALVLPSESGYVNTDELKSLQWTTNVDAANRLLDSIGAARGADGVRVLPDGTRLGFWKIECPHGWSDWNATLEIVAENAKAIGIEIQTYFPEAPVWTNDKQTGNFDLIMLTTGGGPSPSQPWNRCRSVMYSKGVPPIGETAFWNEGRYRNERADQIIEEIPTVEDKAKLKKLYTELNLIFLKDIPVIPLMYRPWHFFTFNETYWKGFPRDKDGSNVPPQALIYGAGIKALYNLKPAK